MTRYVALLRAVNVGGTGKLPMAALVRLCEAAGFATVRSYVASGNVLFESDQPDQAVQAALEAQLEGYAGRKIGVLLRDSEEMAKICAANPFAGRDPKFTHAIFLDAAVPPDALANARGRADEALALGRREIYVHYPSGSGRSKLRIPEAAGGTARNMNTVAKLAEMLKGS
ncbi:DUF1697 domain-containing protein [Tropicimonas sp. IMCC6043]|uniref:DUF1697 domain-containing protein n=1 Tax=Tropicimonas sp. IMCC6043 TaxID=2510645 RepID=UPI00101D3524|nr:DUF1697 domain-containing protein [Tropicimonas sp. IMCC6043]RYH11821.1 DUF1697 domain-containing protein [Tropicimonas sp. IMCC6043]